MRKRPAVSRPELVKGARRLVVKVGSRVLGGAGVGLQEPTVARLAGELTDLRHQGREVILVSSGAILAGMAALDLSGRPQEIPLKQAAAAVGQGHLMRAYEEAFQPSGQRVAQILLTAEDLRHRTRYLNARNTLLMLLRLGVIPIVNENDTVAVEEIKFGDNDHLSALVAHLVEADLLVILTDTDGVFTADPQRDPDARLIPVVDAEGPAEQVWAGDSTSEVGTGGMSTKMTAARRAAVAGVPTVVASGLTPGILPRVLDGDEVGTLFVPRPSRMQSRKRWLAFAAKARGTLVVDAGAREVIQHRGKSLLPSGILSVQGAFRAGDVVALVDEAGVEFARGLVNYGVAEVERIRGRRTTEIATLLGYKAFDEVIHRDNLAVLEA